MLPLPVALATPPALVESIESTTRTLASPGFDLPLPWTQVSPPESDAEPQQDGRLGMATDVVEVPASRDRIKAVSLDGELDIPEAALTAYREAAATLSRTDPSCNIDWALLAAIGRVESDHGRFGGATVHADGTTSPAIVGLPLDGSPGVATIRDTDGGELDGDTVWDRAVGPMQFIPTTWATVAADGDGDGVRDPHDIDDAALAAGVYLCAGSGDLSKESHAEAAVFRYNHSDAYVRLVLSLAESYRKGEDALPSTQPRGDGDAPTLDEAPDTSAGGERDARSPRGADTSQRNAEPKRAGGQPSKKSNGGRESGGASSGSSKQSGNAKPEKSDRSPSPKPDPRPEPDPKPDPDPEPEPGPDPEPEPDPEPREVERSGDLSQRNEFLYVTQDDGQSWRLDFSEVEGQVDDDYDKDGEPETIKAEFQGLVERENPYVRVKGEERDPGVVTILRVVEATFEPKEPEPEPEAVEMTGTVSSSDGGGWVLTGEDDSVWLLDFERGQETASGDYDGDGNESESLVEELQGAEAEQTKLAFVGQRNEDGTVSITSINGYDAEQDKITARPRDS